jgi:DNA-binding response OmpR family regulator
MTNKKGKKSLKKNIMVIDDDEMLLNVLDIVLTEEGFDVSLVRDTTSLMNNLEKQRPDLVLLDLIMPEKDGTEVLEDIRGFSEDIPVIFMSASHKVKEKAINCRAHGYISKPFEIEELNRIIRENIK